MLLAFDAVFGSLLPRGGRVEEAFLRGGTSGLGVLGRAMKLKIFRLYIGEKYIYFFSFWFVCLPDARI